MRFRVGFGAQAVAGLLDIGSRQDRDRVPDFRGRRFAGPVSGAPQALRVEGHLDGRMPQ